MAPLHFPPIRRLGLSTVGLLLTGCAGGLAGWRRAPTPLPPCVAPRQQVQIWPRGHNILWHGVEIRGDTLLGTPYHRPLACDSCRQRLPLAAVDSIRLGSLEQVGWVVAASPWLLGAALLAYLRFSWPSD